MHVLVTGHTGFKGAWLTMMLTERGHQVSGLALDPLPGALFEVAGLHDLLEQDHRVDIRDATATHAAISTTRPDVVMHLAAQPLVRASYADPEGTMATNVTGTLHVLQGIWATSSVRANVIVTTDKVYRNVGQAEGYREDDALGGTDPYSASKAMADLLTQSWVASFPGPATAIARAGNVIGGGDVSPDRLLPDLISSFAARRAAVLRYPAAVRPWQHVTDCLNGYLLLVDALLAGTGAGAWNFGPDPTAFSTVGEVADLAAREWGAGASWTTDDGEHPHEAHLLTLDSAKARAELGWRDRLEVEAAVTSTVDWHRRVTGGADPRTVTLEQLRDFADRGAGPDRDVVPDHDVPPDRGH